MQPLVHYVPALGWLRAYQRDWLRADLISGLTAGAVVIPQAMAYATVAGMPVEVGLYTCLVPALVYAFIGGSRAMSFSTTSTIATLSASTLLTAGIAAASPQAEEEITTLSLLVGAILVLAHFLRLAGLVENISDALLVGLKIGVGLTVAVGQLPKLLGVPPADDGASFFVAGWRVIRQAPDANVPTALLAFGTIAGLVLQKRFLPRLPGPLVAVAGGIALMAAAHLADHGVTRIGDVPTGLPMPAVPTFDHITGLLPGAIAIAMMAFLETVSVARSIRTLEEPSIRNDQELVANGVANVAGSLFGAMPAAGGFSQSAVNRNAGARTQVSALTMVILAVLTAFFLGPVLSDLPQATLGAIVVVATLGLVSIPDLVRLVRFDRLEFIVAALTGAVALIFGLLVAVAAGVVLTIYLVLKELNRAPLVEMGTRTDGALVPGGKPVDGLLVLRLSVPLYTANARAAADRITDHVAYAGRPIHVVLLDATAVGRLSMTILSRMHDLERALNGEGIELWVSSLPETALKMARRTPGWARWSQEGRVWPTTADAVAAHLRGVCVPSSPGADDDRGAPATQDHTHGHGDR